MMRIRRVAGARRRVSGYARTALRTVPASLAAVSFSLIPVFGVAAGWALLDERLEAVQWVGIAIVAAAIAAIVGTPLRARSSAARSRPPAR